MYTIYRPATTVSGITSSFTDKYFDLLVYTDTAGSSESLAPHHYQTDSSHGPRLVRTRGYHRHVYEPIPRQGPCCDCSSDRSKGAQSSERCNWGVACGCVLSIIGVIAILMGFTVPQKSQKAVTPCDEKNCIKSIFSLIFLSYQDFQLPPSP